MPTQLYTTTPTAGDDFWLFTNSAVNPDGGDGDDYIIAFPSSQFVTGATTDFAHPGNIDSSTVWATTENPYFADSSIPHLSLYLRTDAGQNAYSSVTVGDGQTITVDIDFGNNNTIGVDTDTVVQLYDSGGNLVATNDDGGNDAGGAGSTSALDSFLTFTNTTGGPVVYTIAFREFGGDQLFEGGETFVANIAVTGHDATGSSNGSGFDTIHGGTGDDTIAGLGGNDTLFGDVGNDTLIGGSGNDSLDGGDGVDYASYGGATSAVTVDLSNSGPQNTGGAGTDTLTSIEAVFGSSFDDTFIGSTGNDIFNGSAGTDLVSYANATGAVTVDLGLSFQNSVSAGNDTLISIESAIGSVFNDALTGSGLANVLWGAGGNDMLSGGFGNDTLNGGAGSDTLDGGVGNDTLNGGADFDTATYASSSGAVIVDLNISGYQNTGGGGVDRLISMEGVTGSAFNDVLIAGATYATLQGGNGNDTLTGGLLGDVLQGQVGNDVATGGSGGDILQGGDGDDTLSGGDDADIVQGDTGNDTEFGGDGADIVQGGANDDTLFGDDGDDIVQGDTGNDNVFGGAGNDIVQGGADNDMIRAESGDDTADGGDGDDSIDGGDGIDTAYYGNSSAAVAVSLAIDGPQNTLGAGIDTLISIENLSGTIYNDSLTGDSGDNVLQGFAGDDMLIGGAGSDTASYNGTSTGVTVSLAIAGAQDTGVGLDTLVSIENLIGSSGDDTLTGSSAANRLDGSYGSDYINGGSGADTMVGGYGDDTFIVKEAGDVVIEDSDAGTDTIRSTISINNLAANVENLVLLSTANLNGSGNELNNIITGNNGNNILKGREGLDMLRGGAGNDSLYGGVGNDTLTGGAGVDKFYFNSTLSASTNVDRISDFAVADDTIYLDRNIFSAISANGTLAGTAFFAGSAAHDSDDRIIYNSTTGNIYYDADGNGSDAAIRFAKVTAGTALTRADFVAFSDAAAALSKSAVPLAATAAPTTDYSAVADSSSLEQHLLSATHTLMPDHSWLL